MNMRTEPLKVTFTLAPETVRSIFDLIAEASGGDPEDVKARKRLESSQNAIYGKDEPPADNNLLVSMKQIASLLQISTRKIENLRRLGQMPQPIRIGKAVRWNRAELTDWVDAGCPDCNLWNRGEVKSKNNIPSVVQKRGKKGQSPTKTRTG